MAHTTNAAYTQNTHHMSKCTHTEHILIWLAFNLLEDIDAAIDVIEGRWIHKQLKCFRFLVDKTSVLNVYLCYEVQCMPVH